MIEDAIKKAVDINSNASSSSSSSASSSSSSSSSGNHDDDDDEQQHEEEDENEEEDEDVMEENDDNDDDDDDEVDNNAGSSSSSSSSLSMRSWGRIHPGNIIHDQPRSRVPPKLFSPVIKLNTAKKRQRTRYIHSLPRTCLPHIFLLTLSHPSSHPTPVILSHPSSNPSSPPPIHLPSSYTSPSYTPSHLLMNHQHVFSASSQTLPNTDTLAAPLPLSHNYSEEICFWCRDNDWTEESVVSCNLCPKVYHPTCLGLDPSPKSLVGRQTHPFIPSHTFLNPFIHLHTHLSPTLFFTFSLLLTHHLSPFLSSFSMYQKCCPWHLCAECTRPSASAGKSR